MGTHWISSGRVSLSTIWNSLSVSPRQTTQALNVIRISIGIMVLSIGALFYVFYRKQVYLLSLLHLNVYTYTHHFMLSDIVYGSLPSFVHIVSFSMITSGIIGGTISKDVFICMGWLLVELVFEYLQKYKVIVLVLPPWLSELPVVSQLKTYIIYGTFDYNDVFALLLGFLISYCLMRMTLTRKGVEL